MSIAAGVVCVTEFCSADSSAFSGYINYIDRDEAVRIDNAEKYDLFADYQNYMDDNEKTTGLFTKNESILDKNEKSVLKNMFKKAQENGSMMWQTIFSFDNRWLDMVGIYDPEEDMLDQERLKTVIRSAVGKMLEKEDLTNAVWSAAIHHNTDNYHVHVAITEPVPARAKKEYVQFEKEKVNGKWQYKKERDEITGKTRKVPLRDKNGDIIKKEEYVGRFKESSIKTAKSEIVRELAGSKEINKEINSLIRERIIKNARENPLFADEKFRERLMGLYEKLPDNVDRNLWSYNTAVMTDLRPEIDALTEQYIQTYHMDDFDRLKAILKRQSEVYKTAYGKADGYTDNKVKDLYQRMGNTILAELKDYDREIKKPEESYARQADHAEKESSAAMSKQYRKTRNEITLKRAMRQLRKSLEYDYKNWRNLQEYERLQNEISFGRGEDQTLS